MLEHVVRKTIVIMDKFAIESLGSYIIGAGLFEIDIIMAKIKC